MWSTGLFLPPSFRFWNIVKILKFGARIRSTRAGDAEVLLTRLTFSIGPLLSRFFSGRLPISLAHRIASL